MQEASVGQANCAISRRGGIDRRLADSPVGLCQVAPEFHSECSVCSSVLGALFDFFEKRTESGITMK